ncbi:isopentenyl-diphosphate Delta-isomerase [Citricoccus sp. I39-566]|uniref:isopentenyl-diphosphate Delta-isomerase n=1 Tax=Citricoccus sp. I39-566 TaxID=3073268 RepID=UPI00286B1422|nr:isopentenyl-diphosphate Delta-isomerase [Citricoccus sp. I39-566]WMY78540.1 isopentenyl-diphosphate Delta-isomerase [Citricoccus sp. I39-566]
MTVDTMDEDHVVLVDEQGRPQGLAPRATVHTEDTPLHLAFSCYVFRPDGDVLLTRRALAKVAWPGVWTNSFCGHPRQGETFVQAIERYADHELGLEVRDIQCVLPDFRYRAVDASGVVENEICPVFTAGTTGTPRPNPDEAMDHRWIPLTELGSLVELAPWAVSPWMAEQLPGLRTSLPPTEAETT